LGTHKNPQTLDFIKRLKEKGEALGYKTAEEEQQASLNGVCGLAWCAHTNTDERNDEANDDYPEKNPQNPLFLLLLET